MARAPHATAVRPWAVDGHTLLMITSRFPLRVMAYHLDTNTWVTLPAPPVSLRSNVVLAAGHGYAYVTDDAVAGSGPLHRVQRLDLSTRRWNLLPPSTNRPRIHLVGLFVTAHGPLMAGLNPYAADGVVQVEALDHGHWHRFATPNLDASYYTFAWTGSGLAAAFPPGGGSGQTLDPTTGQWTSLAGQPDPAHGSTWWQDATTSVRGARILRWGDVFDTHTGRTLRLTQPQGAGPGVSAGLVHHGIYVMDNNSRLWTQRL